MDILISFLAIVFDFVVNLWWIILPPFFVYIALETWKYYVISKGIKEGEWVLFEIKIPREILKSPEAMERVFSGLHGPYDPPEEFKDFYLAPKIRWWYNFEIVGQNGDMRFYVYLPKPWQNVLKAQMYAQYPNVTIVEAQDYTKSVPDVLPSEEYDMWGMELKLAKENAYPIITYRDFKSLSDPQIENEDLKVDPLSAFSESLATLRPGEQIWFQILARPCGKPGSDKNDNWQKDGQELIDQLTGRKEKVKKESSLKPLTDITEALFEEVGEGIKEVIQPGTSSGERGLGKLSAVPAKKDDSKKEPSRISHMTQGEKDVISAMERKISKLGFESVVRVIYVARKEVFDMSTIGSLFGMVKQYNTQHLNAFRPNGKTLTKKQNLFFGFFSSKKYQNRVKQGLIYSYKRRSLFWGLKTPLPSVLIKDWFPGLTAFLESFFYHLLPGNAEMMLSEPIVLNTEEMATLFHFPGKTVSSPAMPRMQAKQSEPPINLPTA